MTRSHLERLRDCRLFAADAFAIGRDVSAASLATDPVRLHALLFRLIIIGESIGGVPEAIRSLEPGVPWRDIVRTRNLLVHGYWQVELPIVVTLVAHDLIPLIAALDRLIAVMERDDP